MEITYFMLILKIQNIQCNTAAITAKLCFRNLNSNYDRNTYLMSKAGQNLFLSIIIQIISTSGIVTNC